MNQQPIVDQTQLRNALLRGLGIGLLIGAAFVGGFFYNELLSQPKRSETSYELLNEAEGVLSRDFLFDLPSDENRVHAAVAGMVASLNDPYTYFVEPQAAEVDQGNLAGRFGGIGAELTQNEQGQFVITTVYRDNPAAEAGVVAGDIITAVDGIDVTTGTDMNDLLTLVRGEIGEPVRLTLDRDGEILNIEIVRAEVLIPSVFWRVLEEDSRVGYIQIVRFTHRTSEEVQQALDELQATEPDAYVIDLRNNGGGLVDSAVDVAGHFLDGGLVLTEERADGTRRTFRASQGGDALDVPVVLLVNGGTASAAEILAGAFLDRERAPLIGQQTFGKGSVQVLRDLSDGSTLHVTTAQWFTPNGHRIQDTGLTPDVAVEPVDGEDVELMAALDYLQEHVAALAETP